MMEFVQVGDVVLHAAVRGDRRKPLLALANSLGSDARIWSMVIPHLVERYSLLLYDKRGHGWSDAPPGPYSIGDHVGDLMGLLDHFGTKRFGLVGLSVGGLIAQAVAAQHPDQVAAAVLFDTAAKLGTEEVWETRIQSVEYSGLESVADSTLERWFTRAYRDREKVAMRGWRNMLTRQPTGGYAATCATLRDTDLRGTASAIQCPTLLAVGDGDASTPPDVVRGTAEMIRHARFEIIPDCGHLPPIEQPGLAAELIVNHFEQVGFV